jgi:hypothetical protein
MQDTTRSIYITFSDDTEINKWLLIELNQDNIIKVRKIYRRKTKFE